MATDIYQSYEYNYTPDRTRSPEKCPKILYTQLRNIGSRLSYDRMAQKFFGLPDALSCLTPSTVLGNRCGYMFAINDNVTLRSISVDKQAEIKFDYEQGVLGATIKGKGCAEEVRYVCQSDTHTFFVVKFGQGNCCLQLGWNETNKTTLVSTKSKPGTMITTSYVPSYTDNNSISYSQESPFDSGSNSMQYEVYPAIAENPQELKECTNVLVLVSADNQRLWNTIYSAMKGQQVIKAYHDRIIVRLMLNPFNTIVVMALSYHEHNVGDVRVAVSCADNVIFYGNSSESYSYVLSAMTYRNNIFQFDDPFLNPQQWRQMTVDIKSICYKSASVLDVIKDHGGKSYAFMMSNNDDYCLVPDTMKNQIIPRCKATPITPELYTCWKFTGLVGQTEEEYRRQVNEFIQRYGIPAVIDAVCRGCVAVIMHGPRWMWWYLTAFKDEISTAFGSDLRSITQIGVNNVAELMKRKDNARFRASLSQLRSRMIGHNVPVCIQHKLSIVFESGSKKSTLSCIHSNTVEAAVVVKPEPICKTSEMVKQALGHYNKPLVDYPQAIDLLAAAISDFRQAQEEQFLTDFCKTRDDLGTPEEVEIVKDFLLAGQNQLQAANMERIHVSSRDIMRAIDLYAYFSKTPAGAALLGLPADSCVPGHHYYSQRFWHSLFMACNLAYCVRLAARSILRSNLMATYKAISLTYGYRGESIGDVIERCYTHLYESTAIPDGIARMKILKENLFVLVTCVDAKIPVMTSGPAGTSKTIILTIIADNMRNKAYSNEFYRLFSQVHPFRDQCTQHSMDTEADGVYKSAIRRQKFFENDATKNTEHSTVFLDEAGLSDDSEMPLKALHYHLDHPVASPVIHNRILDAEEMSEKVTCDSRVNRRSLAADPMPESSLKIPLVTETARPYKNSIISQILAVSLWIACWSVDLLVPDAINQHVFKTELSFKQRWKILNQAYTTWTTCNRNINIKIIGKMMSTAISWGSRLDRDRQIVKTSALEYDQYIKNLSQDLRERWAIWQLIRTYFSLSLSPRFITKSLKKMHQRNLQTKRTMPSILRLSDQSATMNIYIRSAILIQPLTDQLYEDTSTSQEHQLSSSDQNETDYDQKQNQFHD